MKRRNSDAEDQAGLHDRRDDGTDQDLAGEQPGQRERERERRVSDADASYNGPAKTTRTLNNAIPQRKHAKNNPLSKNDPVPLPRAPLNKFKADHEDQPKTRPYVRPTPNRGPQPTRQTAPMAARNPCGLQRHGSLYRNRCLLSSPC
jgi:hypothetical protein